MATSSAHQFGQMVGNIIESAIEPELVSIAEKHRLYFDKKGKRTARNGLKVRWKDKHGNFHDLDYVIERGGTDSHIGSPAAFIEVAWRRYTRHSKNKAQEIQGAIQPLKETYFEYSPFAGVVLAGEFTRSSVNQLISLGFFVLYWPYKDILDSLRSVGIDADFDENTRDSDFRRATKKLKTLTVSQKSKLAKRILEIDSVSFENFIKNLEISITRRVESVLVYPMHSKANKFTSVDEALRFINDYSEGNVSSDFLRYEVFVKYSNGDSVSGSFAAKSEAASFLANVT